MKWFKNFRQRFCDEWSVASRDEKIRAVMAIIQIICCIAIVVLFFLGSVLR